MAAEDVWPAAAAGCGEYSADVLLLLLLLLLLLSAASGWLATFKSGHKALESVLVINSDSLSRAQ